MHFFPQDIAQFVQKYDEDGSGSIDFQEFFMMISEILGEAKDAIAKKNQDHEVMCNHSTAQICIWNPRQM